MEYNILYYLMPIVYAFIIYKYLPGILHLQRVILRGMEV